MRSPSAIARPILGTEVVAIERGAVVPQEGSRIAADHVVAAVTPQDLRKLGRDAPAVEPSPYISCYLWFASNIIYSHRGHALSDAAIVAATQREIAQFVPEAARARVVHAVVNRIPMAIPCPLPGSESERRAPSLAVAGDWTRTGLPCSMESAVRSGWLAAEEVLRAAGRPKRLAFEPQPPQGLAGLVHRLSSRAN